MMSRVYFLPLQCSKGCLEPTFLTMFDFICAGCRALHLISSCVDKWQMASLFTAFYFSLSLSPICTQRQEEPCAAVVQHHDQIYCLLLKLSLIKMFRDTGQGCSSPIKMNLLEANMLMVNNWFFRFVPS